MSADVRPDPAAIEEARRLLEGVAVRTPLEEWFTDTDEQMRGDDDDV